VIESDDDKRIPFTCNVELPDESFHGSSSIISTTLSKHAFGKRSRSRRLDRIRRRLHSTNQIMEQMEKKSSVNLCSSSCSNHTWENENLLFNENQSRCPSPPVLEEDQGNETNQLQIQKEVWHVDKWSLERAILLYGSQQERSNEEIDEIASISTREELLSNMDESLKRASLDLYTAYSITVNTINTLHLPTIVRSEVTERLVRYAYKNDGFALKGVRSKLSKKHNDNDRESLKERLKEYNSLKQISAVSAAILFLSARHLGWTRSMESVRSCFCPQMKMTANEKSFLKPKHIARAVKQVQCVFSEFARLPLGEDTFESGRGETMTETNNNKPTSLSFPDEIIEKLQLPPVAEASIHFLFSHCNKQRRREDEQPFGNVTAWTLCAALTFFVCTMGSSMQTLANEVHRTNSHRDGKRGSEELNNPVACQWKRRRQECPSETGERNCNKTSQPSDRVKIKKDLVVSLKEGDVDASVLAKHICQNQSMNKKYEMRRMWDAWESQRSWSRSVAEIEHCSGISREALLDTYQTELCPHRDALLCMLRDSSQVGSWKDTKVAIRTLGGAPLASILLADIPTVAPLMMMAQQDFRLPE
jgi:hypothetical protein